LKNEFMKRVMKVGAMASFALLSSAAWSAATVSFTDSYNGASASGGSCGTSYSISGVEPADTAKHPVFVYTVGTTETYNDAAAMAAVHSMAAKGFVAATVGYGTSSFGDCSVIKSKTSCIYDPNNSASAIAKLCSRASADCSKGIVTGGFSQGSVIAIQAKNYDARVQAAFGMGAHNLYSTYNLSACMNNGNHTLTSDRLRISAGDVDIFPGGTQATVQKSETAVTGKTCADKSFSCLNSNGSGWIIVKDSQVQDLSADHCFMRYGGCSLNENNLDTGWSSGTLDWQLGANLNWLSGYATP
jgi:hypothetical protein